MLQVGVRNNTGTGAGLWYVIFLEFFLRVLNFVHCMTLAIKKTVNYAANPIYHYLIPILPYKSHFMNPIINPVEFIPLISNSY